MIFAAILCNCDVSLYLFINIVNISYMVALETVMVSGFSANKKN